MIAIANSEGSLLKLISGDEIHYGFHQIFGFISESRSQERSRAKKLNLGKRISNSESRWDYRFKVLKGESTVEIQAQDNCTAKKVSNNEWLLDTPSGSLKIFGTPTQAQVIMLDEQATKDKFSRYILLFLLLLFGVFGPILGRLTLQDIAQEPEIAPTIVKIQVEKQKIVHVPMADQLKLPEQVKQTDQSKRPLPQNLGFLKLLGNPKMTKAVGGIPVELKDVSPGAGPGGKEGSGGELLVGLGQGLTRTTVGNSGVKGLGGVGTKGAGGGQGGYGNSMVGSGEGRALSRMALSDEIMLEGGLDRAVIQATIAKYISQIRACYEDGLKKVPGLSGTVTMAFEIGGVGNLNFSKVSKTTLENSEVEQCISTKMMGWKFPKPLGGVNVKVAYPFLLRPVSS
jgi:hypothetical protein